MKKLFKISFVLLLLLVLTTSCKKKGCTDPEATNYDSSASKDDYSCEYSYEFSYEVTGTANDYSVTLEGAPSGTVQYANVSSGWWYNWTRTGQGTRFLYLSAQNNTSAGSVTVKIIKDGVTIAENTSVGGYVIATVSGDY